MDNAESNQPAQNSHLRFFVSRLAAARIEGETFESESFLVAVWRWVSSASLAVLFGVLFGGLALQRSDIISCQHIDSNFATFALVAMNFLSLF